MEGSVPPFGCIWLWAMSPIGCTSHCPCMYLACFCVSSCACVCITLAVHRCFLCGLPALFLLVFMCLFAILCLFIPVHISIYYNNPISWSHFSACDLSGSEFPIHCLLLLLHPHVCSEVGQKGKAEERDPISCCMTPILAPCSGKSGEVNRELNRKMRRLRTPRRL